MKRERLSVAALTMVKSYDILYSTFVKVVYNWSIY